MRSASHHRPATVLIGEGPLALRCLEILVAQGLAPDWVGSFDGSLANAAARHHCAHLQLRHEMTQRLAQTGCDHLVSVHSPWNIPGAVLNRVRCLAVAYHDGPLPRYAGTHAVSWALAHGETQHGVSWHELSGGLDAGVLLSQVMLPITLQDTAATLGAKCFEAAVQSFEALAAKLRQGTWSTTPQQGRRSYFSLRRRPAAQGALDFNHPAQAIADQIRALDFGSAPNPLGSAKLWLAGEEAVLVRTAQVLAKTSTASPGTLLANDNDGLVVATTTTDVRLTDLARLTGETLSPHERLARFAPRTGYRLPALDPGLRAEVSALAERICLHEDAWVRLWSRSVQPAALPFAQPAATAATAAQ